jgi:cyclophilin family peptidyl-prolyl cis-trans isomerase
MPQRKTPAKSMLPPTVAQVVAAASSVDKKLFADESEIKDSAVTRNTNKTISEATLVAVADSKTLKDTQPLVGKAEETISTNNDVKESYRDRLSEFYKQYNPSKLDTVDATLLKFQGKEEELFEKLDKKYVQTLSKFPSPSGEGPTCFLEFEFGQENGRVEVKLFADKTPLAAENFRALCTGELGMGRSTKPLCFRNCSMHRIVENFVIQGGDFTKGDGTGGESIYPPNSQHGDMWGKFKDEAFLQHNQKGLLSMANNGANRNGSQFFITLAALPNLNGKHVVFGRVMSGMEVVDRISKLTTDKKQRPLERVLIADCGEIRDGKEIRASEQATSSSATQSSTALFGFTACKPTSFASSVSKESPFSVAASSSATTGAFGLSASSETPFSFSALASKPLGGGTAATKPFSFASDSAASQQTLSSNAFGGGAAVTKPFSFTSDATAPQQTALSKPFGGAAATTKPFSFASDAAASQQTAPSKAFDGVAAATEPFSFASVAKASQQTVPSKAFSFATPVADSGATSDAADDSTASSASSESTASSDDSEDDAATARPFGFAAGGAPTAAAFSFAGSMPSTDTTTDAAASTKPFSFAPATIKSTDESTVPSVSLTDNDGDKAPPDSASTTVQQAKPFGFNAPTSEPQPNVVAADKSSAPSFSFGAKVSSEAAVDKATPSSFSTLALDSEKPGESMCKGPALVEDESRLSVNAEGTTDATVEEPETDLGGRSDEDSGALQDNGCGGGADQEESTLDDGTYTTAAPPKSEVKPTSSSTATSRRILTVSSEAKTKQQSLAEAEVEKKSAPNPFAGVNFAQKASTANPFVGFNWTGGEERKDEQVSPDKESEPVVAVSIDNRKVSSDTAVDKATPSIFSTVALDSEKPGESTCKGPALVEDESRLSVNAEGTTDATVEEPETDLGGRSDEDSGALQDNGCGGGADQEESTLDDGTYTTAAPPKSEVKPTSSSTATSRRILTVSSEAKTKQQSIAEAEVEKKSAPNPFAGVNFAQKASTANPFAGFNWTGGEERKDEQVSLDKKSEPVVAGSIDNQKPGDDTVAVDGDAPTSDQTDSTDEPTPSEAKPSLIAVASPSPEVPKQHGVSSETAKADRSGFKLATLSKSSDEIEPQAPRTEETWQVDLMKDPDISPAGSSDKDTDQVGGSGEIVDEHTSTGKEDDNDATDTESSEEDVKADPAPPSLRDATTPVPSEATEQAAASPSNPFASFAAGKPIEAPKSSQTKEQLPFSFGIGNAVGQPTQTSKLPSADNPFATFAVGTTTVPSSTSSFSFGSTVTAPAQKEEQPKDNAKAPSSTTPFSFGSATSSAPSSTTFAFAQNQDAKSPLGSPSRLSGWFGSPKDKKD